MKLVFIGMPGIIFTLLFPAFFVYASTNNKINIGDSDKSIKIGFLIPMQPEKDGLSREAFYGARLAIEEANNKKTDIPFKMIIRITEGPWGAGSKRAVDLVYKDEVCSMVTSLDGRNAHLAEQVITKAQVALIITRATDPTITKAFVPWVFRVIPNDEQQALVLAKNIYQVNNFKHLLILTGNTYDSKGGANAFLREAQAGSHPLPRQLFFDSDTDMKMLVEKIKNIKADAIVIFGLPEESSLLLNHIKFNNLNIPIFGPVSLLYDNTLIYNNTEKEINVVAPGFLQTKKGLTFQMSFKKRYGFTPGAVAANAYEGMMLMIHAIQKVGSDRDKIRQYFLQIKNYPGVNGIINFDENGNLKTELSLINIDALE